MRMALAAVTAISLSATIDAGAAPLCAAKSGAGLTPLVELYTSEGCSSCPPADRWLSERFGPEGRATQASVLAFHVDYWDRLGWKDRFAARQFTDRQYAAMRANRASFVYTPQVLVQGRDAPGWRSGGAEAMVVAARKLPARATIALAAMADGDGALQVRADATITQPALRKDAQLLLAYTTSGLDSDVKAGENSGERLRHDQVVRTLHGPFPFDAQGDAHVEIRQALPPERGTSTALVAVVQNGRSGEVLQTLTVPACGGH